MGPMNPRMNPPRGPSLGGPMGPGGYGPGGMRGPPPGMCNEIILSTLYSYSLHDFIKSIEL